MKQTNYGRNKRYYKPKKYVDSLVDYANKQHNLKSTRPSNVGNKLYDEAVAIHSNVYNRTSSKYLSEVKDYSDANLAERDTVVKLSRDLRSKEGVCSSVADLLIDFAISRGGFYTDNDELQILLDKWSRKVNISLNTDSNIISGVPGIRVALRKIFDSYLTDGDCVFTLSWQDVDFGEDSFFVPSSLKTIDTTLLKADENLAKFGEEVLTLKLPDAIVKKIKSPETKEDKEFTNKLPKEWIKAIRNNDPIILKSSVTYHLKRNPKDYKVWGEPLFLKAFTAIANKRRLQAVDEATIDGLINRFTIFKLGLADVTKNAKYHIPSRSRVQALVNIINNPKRANAMVWPGPDLEVIDIGPDGKILEFVDKYRQADKDILRALHVPPLLIDGTSDGQTSRDWAAFLSTEVGLDAFRGEVEMVLSDIAAKIAEANDMEYEDLYYKFDSQLLKDEQRVRNFALRVYELGAISTKTFVQTMGYDWNTEKRRKETEQQDGTTDLFVNRNLPYQGQPNEAPSSDEEPGRTPDRDTERTEEPEEREVTASLVPPVAIYTTIFSDMKKELENRKEAAKRDFSVVESILVGGFALLAMLTGNQIREAFRRQFRVGFQDELDQLISWNQSYLDNFYIQMLAELRTSKVDVGLFAQVFEKQEYRLFMYQEEIAVKVELMKEIIMAEQNGYDGFIWEAKIDDKTCPICIANHGKFFGTREIFNYYVAHPNCRCHLKRIKNDGRTESKNS